MTGPADDAELCVKMLNSGAPGVMLDLEDSMANTWEHLMLGHRNIVAALYGELTYEDAKRGGTVRITPSNTVVWNRVRGLHLSQGGRSRARAHQRVALRSRAARLSTRLRAAAPRRCASTFPSRNPPRKRCGGATSSTRSAPRRAGRATRSRRWRWSNRIRWHTRSRSSSSTCASTSWASTWAAGTTWRA